MILKVANGSGIFKGHGWHIVKEIMVKFTFTIDSKKITYLKLTPPKKKRVKDLYNLDLNVLVVVIELI